MAQNSKIEWTHHTANLWHGCTKVHEGCDNTALRWQGLELLTFKQVQKMNRITNAQNIDVSPAFANAMLGAVLFGSQIIN